MPKDILLYGEIYKYSALYFFEQIKEAQLDDADAQFTLRINTEGGEPEYGMSVIAKVQELADHFSIKGESMLHSMGLFLLCYVPKEKIEVFDISKGVLHRAAYPNWIESMQGFTESVHYEILVKTNKDLEKAFRARVDVDALENLPQFKEKDLTLKDIFSLESRIEVLLTSADMKKIGLVNSIQKITPSKASAMSAQLSEFKKCRSLEDFKLAAKATTKNDEPNNTDMTLEELKAKFPALYAQVIADGKASGLNEERERIRAWEAYRGIDAAAVDKGIKDGKVISATDVAEFTAKALSPEHLKKIMASNAPDVQTTPVNEDKPKTETEKEVAVLEADVRKRLGLKPLTA